MTRTRARLRRFRRRLPAARRDDAGFSLLELMMAMFLLGIVLPVGYSAVFSAQKAVDSTEKGFASVSQAQLAMDAVTKDIRAIESPPSGASSVVSASANDLQFYSAVDNPSSGYPALVELKLTACTGCTTTSLVEDTILPKVSSGSVSYPVATMTVRTLAANVVAPTASPATDCPSGSGFTPGLFEYFTSSAGSTTCDALSTAATPDSLATTDLPNLAMVQVAVSTQLATGAPTAAVTDSVYLLNNFYGSA